MAPLPRTARGVAALSAPYNTRRTEYLDTAVPGLTLRVSSRGVKSWTLVYRHRGRQRRLTLGRFPDLSLREARRRAITERGRISAGVDPATVKRHERAGASRTLGDLYELYRNTMHRNRSWPEQRRIFEKEVLPFWRARHVEEVTRGDIRALVHRKADTAPIMANRLLARVSRLFSFAVELDWIPTNPARHIRKPTVERGRDRILTRVELCELWSALRPPDATLPSAESGQALSVTLNDALIVMLLTAQRCGEVCRMRWQDVDMDNAWWTIPADVSKNNDAHRVPLTSHVVSILKRRQFGGDNLYVFSNHPLTSIAWRAKKAASRLSRDLSFTFRAHDLTRTAASFMAEGGIDRFHIALILNHRSVTHSTVTAIYDRYRYDKEKRAALEAWAVMLKGIVTPLHGAQATTSVASEPSGGPSPVGETRRRRSLSLSTARSRLIEIAPGVYLLHL